MKNVIIKGLYYTALSSAAISSCIQCMKEYRRYKEGKFETSFMKFKLCYPKGGVVILDPSFILVTFSIDSREDYRVFHSLDEWKNWTIDMFHDV